jgi:hypothetical protein
MNEEIKVKGEWGFYSLAPEIREDDPAVGDLRGVERGTLTELVLNRLVEKGIVLRVVHQTNIVPTCGRAVLARLLAGTATPTGEINYIALGTGTTAFTNASVQLNVETFRKIVSDASYDNNIAYIDCFIASGDVANQTFQEAGAFIDGGAGANTGTAFSLVVQGMTKSGSMYVSLKITLT